MGAVYEKILVRKIKWKILSRKMGKMVAVSKTIPSLKTGVKNSKMENWRENLELIKILGWKICVKISSQKMKKKLTNGWNVKWVEKTGVGENILSWKISKKLESVKRVCDGKLVWKILVDK